MLAVKHVLKAWPLLIRFVGPFAMSTTPPALVQIAPSIALYLVLRAMALREISVYLVLVDCTLMEAA